MTVRAPGPVRAGGTRATVVVPTFERTDHLRRALLALDNQTACGEFDVVVVDDGSVADTRAVLRSLEPSYPWQWFWQPKQGFRAAKARNTGILFGRGDIVIFLDDDMVVQPHFVEAHLEIHDDHDDLAVIGLRHRVPHKVWSSAIDDPERWDEDLFIDPRLSTFEDDAWRDTPWAFFATCNASVSRQAIVAGGMFDEGFHAWGFEDSELAYRLHSIGLDFLGLLEPAPYHLEARGADLTELATYELPPDKLAGYQTGADFFAQKYPDDRALQSLLTHDRLLRMLATKGFWPHDAPHPDPECVPIVVPRHLSLLTPYVEGDDNYAPQPRARPAVPVTATRSDDPNTSLLDELRRDIGDSRACVAGGHRRIQRPNPSLPDWLVVVLMTPMVMLLCLVLVVALVVTGRYRRIFRARRA